MKAMTALILGIAALALGACSDPKGATRILEAQGYTDIRIEGYAWAFSGCGDTDTWRTKFTARGAGGREIRGIVCQGVFGPATVRVW